MSSASRGSGTRRRMKLRSRDCSCLTTSVIRRSCSTLICSQLAASFIYGCRRMTGCEYCGGCPVFTISTSHNAPERPSMNIEVIPATAEQEPILANLLELYAHDFSEFCDVEIGADGRFGYQPLPLYWSEPGRHPVLVWVESKLAGLVLVKRGSNVSNRKST